MIAVFGNLEQLLGYFCEESYSNLVVFALCMY
jgi:hypothetical protein